MVLPSLARMASVTDVVKNRPDVRSPAVNVREYTRGPAPLTAVFHGLRSGGDGENPNCLRLFFTARVALVTPIRKYGGVANCMGSRF